LNETGSTRPENPKKGKKFRGRKKRRVSSTDAIPSRDGLEKNGIGFMNAQETCDLTIRRCGEEETGVVLELIKKKNGRDQGKPRPQ